MDEPGFSRRRFRRQLLPSIGVIAILIATLVWAGYSVRLIRQRQAFAVEHYNTVRLLTNEQQRAPGGLWLFGEKRIRTMIIHHLTEPAAVERAKQLFPEAETMDWEMNTVFVEGPDQRPGYWIGGGMF